MKKLLFIGMLLLSLNASAQREVGTLTIQPKIGFNVATLLSVDDADPRFGVAGGFEFEYQAAPRIGIAAGVLYSMQGAKFSGIDEGGKVNATMKLDYINVPITANIYIFRDFALKLGIQPGFNVVSCLSGKAGGGKGSFDLPGIKSFDFAFPIGLGYDFGNIAFDARYNISVTKIADDTSAKNGVFQFTVGYKFAL